MRISSVVVFFILLTACSHREVLKKKAFQPGIVRLVQCRSDSSEKYVLFEPAGFPENKKWPLIICFDPHAQGSLPVEKLRAFAEEQGYLLIGSNNAKNGLARLDYTVKILMEEVYSRYPIDPKQVYLAGFSGGGRIAISLAMTSPDFRGVISCGAGAPGIDLSRMPGKTALYALAGDGDFNYQEVEALRRQQVPAGVRVFACIFHGTHAWPSASEMYRAMCWMHLDAMKKNLVTKDEDFIGQCKEELLDSASWFENQKDPLAALKLCQLGASMLDGLTSVRSFRKAESRILESEGYALFKKEESRIMNMEAAAREQYGRAMTEQDTAWWRKEVNSLNRHRNDPTSPSLEALYNRLFGYMSIMAFSYSNRSIQSDDLAAARRFVAIYGIIDPGNPDYLAFRSRLNAH